MQGRTWIIGAVVLGAAGLAVVRWKTPETREADDPAEAENSGEERSRARERVMRKRFDPSSFPAELRALVEGNREGTNREAIERFVIEAAERDPASAVKLAMALDESSGRAHVLHEALPLWLAADPDEARNWLLESIQDMPEELAQAVVRDVAAFDPRLGFEVARQMPHVGERAPTMRDVFASWTARDPAEAARMAETLVTAEGRPAALAEVGRLWAEVDPRAAHAWARELPNEASRRAALDPLMATWAERSPAEAARALESLPEEFLNLRLTTQVAARWVAQDPSAALSWAQSIRSPEARAEAATTVLTQLVHTEPKLAAAWALPLAQGEASSPVVSKFLSAWVAKDAPAAVAWANENVGAEEALFATAFERWQRQDSAAAEGWLRNHPRSVDR